MKKLIALFLSLASIANIVFPMAAFAMVGTESYIIDECNFSDGAGNWEVRVPEGITHGIEQLDAEHGPSYKIVIPADLGHGTYYSFSQKADSFEHGEVTIEADFRYNTGYTKIDLFTLRNDTDTGTTGYVPNQLREKKINGNEIAIHQWHHIKHVMNIEKKYSRTYIDNVLVSSNDNATDMQSFRDIRISLTPIADPNPDNTPTIFYIDNISIKQTQDNTSVSRATISDIEFFTASGVSCGDGTSELTEDVFCANVTMSKPVAGMQLRGRAVKATVNGVETDVYAVGDNISEPHSYQYTWDHDYLDTFTVYFAEKPEKGSSVVLDFTALSDKNGYKVNENCVVTTTVQGDAPTNIKWSLKRADGTQIGSTSQLSDGDEIRAEMAVTSGTLTAAGKEAILVIAAYDGEKMLDSSVKNVTIPDGQATLVSDYLTVAKNGTSDYTVKQFLIMKENVTPAADAGAVGDVSLPQENTVKSEMKVSLTGFKKYTDSGYVFPYQLMRLDYDSAKEKFVDTVCFAVDGNFFWGLDDKYYVTDKALWIDSEMYVSVEMLNKLFGTRTYTFARDVDGKAYVPVVRAAEEVLNINVAVSEHGFAVLSNRKFNLDNENARITVDLMLRYLLNDKPTVEMLRETLSKATHPYLLPVERLQTIKDKIEAGDKTLKILSEAVIHQADNPTYNMMSIEEQEATNTPYNGMTSVEARNYYWAYFMTGDKKYADKAIADAMTMTEWSSYHANTFYLQTSRVISGLAYTLDLFYDELTETQRNKIREAIVTKGLQPIEDRYSTGDQSWARRGTNWNAFCNTGVIMGALAVRDDYAADTTTPMDRLAEAISTLEFQSLSYGPAGSWQEGLDYATMTVNKYIEAIQALRTVYGTDFSLSDVPGFSSYGNFVDYNSTTSGKLALGDSSQGTVANSYASSFIAYETNDVAMQRLRWQKIKLWVYNANFWDLFCHIDDEGSGYAIDLPLDMNYDYTEIATARDNWGDNATFMGIAAGAGDEPHSHADVGTFMYQSDGVVFADDSGLGNYSSSEYLSSDGGWKYYLARAEAHNVFVVNPDSSRGQVKHSKTEVETVETKPNGAIYTVDLTPAYLGQVRKAERGYMLTAGRKVFVVQDEIKPKSKSDQYYWFWHTKADINIIDDSHIRLTKEGKSVDLYFDSNVPFTLESAPIEPLSTSPVIDGQDMGAMTGKIIAKFTSNADEVTFRVTAVPKGMNYSRGSIRKISSWKVADGIRSDEYTIGTDTISNVKYGETVETFLSNIFVEKSKKVTLDGAEVKSGTLKDGMKLVADGRTLDIEFIRSNAEADAYAIVGYDEGYAVEKMLKELSIVLGDSITSSVSSGSVIDGMTVTADGRTYTVRTSNSYKINSITGVREETPTALMLADIENVIGKATADSDTVYDGMKVKTEDGRIYTVILNEPEVLLDFDDYNEVNTPSGAVEGITDGATGFDYIHITGQDSGGNVTLEGKASDRGNNALHITADGTQTSMIGVQMFELVADKDIQNDKFMLEFWYKSNTTAADMMAVLGIYGDGTIPGNNYEVGANVRFLTGGRIVAFGDTVDYLDTDQWHHVKFKISPVEDWRYTLEVNGTVIAEGHSELLLQKQNRLKFHLNIPAGEEASVWLDDIKLTRIYG